MKVYIYFFLTVFLSVWLIFWKYYTLRVKVILSISLIFWKYYFYSLILLLSNLDDFWKYKFLGEIFSSRDGFFFSCQSGSNASAIAPTIGQAVQKHTSTYKYLQEKCQIWKAAPWLTWKPFFLPDLITKTATPYNQNGNPL